VAADAAAASLAGRASRNGGSVKRLVQVILVVAVAIVGSKLLVEDALGVDLEPMLTSWLEAPGVGSAAVIVALLVLDVFFPVPSSVVMVLSGAVFGVLWGALLALLGSIVGQWVGFEMVRRFGRRAASRVAGDRELRDVNRFFERYGAAAVVVTRPLPIVMETMSLVAGLSKMSRRVFLSAAVIGTAPIVLVYAYAGAVSRQAGNWVPAIVILVAVGGAGWLWYRSKRVRPPGFSAEERELNTPPARP
jgi:uncharacterized membrane protein YdjX (TVP38/TMEM64 family)